MHFLVIFCLSQGCILVLNIPTSYQNQGISRTVCVNPSALLNCIAGVLCETDPREYIPQFVKAGKVERFWPTGAKPNEWTLRGAIDDIVSKGFVRESVVPLCFQVSWLFHLFLSLPHWFGLAITMLSFWFHYFFIRCISLQNYLEIMLFTYSIFTKLIMWQSFFHDCKQRKDQLYYLSA